MNNDLLRSCQQYRSQKEMKFLRTGIVTKIGLAFIFFAVLILSLLPKKRKQSNKKAIVYYDNIDTLKSIYTKLHLPSIENKQIRRTFPNLPRLFAKDIAEIWKEDWKLIITNLPFFGSLALRCGQYYSIVRKMEIKTLIVMQEYSYYMSYLTRIMEYEEKQLINIMHGIPGKEASHFRFSRCFVWGEYFKNYYIANHAHPEQFIISGSIYHQVLKQTGCKNDEDIDILYMMQGDTHISADELSETFVVLQQFTSKYKVACKQHPIYSVQNVPKELMVVDGSPTQLICRAKIVLSHHSTSLLDAMVLGKKPLAFTKDDSDGILKFLPQASIVSSKEKLQQTILNILLYPEHVHFIPSAIDDIDAEKVISQVLKG